MSLGARRLLALLAVGPLTLTGCGGDAGSAGGDGELVVFAASSLQPAFESYAERFGAAEVAFSFAGSDTLAAQIREGVEPDVYAAASSSYPDDLHDEGLVQRPVVFASNRLVLAVPAAAGTDSLEAVARPGVSVGIGAPGVPVGDYARDVIGSLPRDHGEAILGNVASEEPDVAGIVGKLTQGAVDAGFVYRSDVEAAGGGLEAIELPGDSAQVAYAAAVAGSSPRPEAAQEFIDGLLEGPGAEALAANGFGPPPPGFAGG